MQQVAEFMLCVEQKQEAGEAIQQEGDLLDQKTIWLEEPFETLDGAMVVAWLYKVFRDIEPL